eukprot:222060-Pyramimonas_sp.AAC.1
MLHAPARVLQDFQTAGLKAANENGRMFAWMVQAAARKTNKLQPRESTPQPPMHTSVVSSV